MVVAKKQHALEEHLRWLALRATSAEVGYLSGAAVAIARAAPDKCGD